jgi:hypothetical protein
MKAKRKVQVHVYSFFNLGARWGVWCCHAPAALPPGKGPGTHCIRGWMGHRAGLDWCGKPRTHRDSISGPSGAYRVAKPTELSRPYNL